MNGIILAGGKSKRLGTDKTVLDFGGKMLTEVVLEAVSTVADDIVIVTNSPHLFSGLPARLTSDIEVGAGPLGGILSGLLVSEQLHNLVVACDMPFLNVELLRYMKSLTEGFDVVIPRLEGTLEPLHAIYSKVCIEPIRAFLAQHNFKIIEFFEIIELLGEVKVRYVEQDEIERFDPSHLSFFNINRPVDLQRAREELDRRSSPTHQP